jgi:hypothetical protein
VRGGIPLVFPVRGLKERDETGEAPILTKHPGLRTSTKGPCHRCSPSARIRPQLNLGVPRKVLVRIRLVGKRR